jgi:hypothetical protein
LTAYTLNVYDVPADRLLYVCDVVFAPDTVDPDTGVPLAGVYMITTELYAPLHDNVVPLIVVDPNVTVDVTTPSVYKLPAVPPVTVKAGPDAPVAVYGTTVNGPYCTLLARPVYVYDDVVWPVATVAPLTCTL